MRFSIFSTILASLAVVDGVFAAKLHVLHAGAKKHTGREISKRGEHQLAKRLSNTRFSFFDTGLGACGKVNKASDFVVAINTPQWDNGNHCFETITITYGGKTTQAQIVDRCVECPYGALDFTRGLFNFFGSESQGYLYGTWSFGSAPEPSPKPTPKPSTTTTWKPSTTSTSTKHTPSTTSTTSTEASTSSTTSTSTSTISTVISTSTSVSVSAPAPTATGILVDTEQIIIAFAGIAIAAAAGNA